MVRGTFYEVVKIDEVATDRHCVGVPSVFTLQPVAGEPISIMTTMMMMMMMLIMMMMMIRMMVMMKMRMMCA